MSQQSGLKDIANPLVQTVRLSDFLQGEWAGDTRREGLASVVTSIATASKYICRSVQAAGLADVLGSTGKVNVQGEVAQVLDELGTEIIAEALRVDGHVAGFACEELEDCQILSPESQEQYICVFDPIDGSSNIDVAAPIGSIFGIYPVTDDHVTEESFLRPGRDQIAALYIIYGSSTQLVLATRSGVNLFTLDTSVGEYCLTSSAIRIPQDFPYYSVNEGNAHAWDKDVQALVSRYREASSLRYIGTLVADFHRGLLKGGIFLYPGDQKNPQGKLRLLYEASPLGYIAEAAGGAASSGAGRILDVSQTSLHQRTPLFIGNSDLVAEVETALANPAGHVA